MLLLARQPGDAGLAVALDFVRPERFEQHLAHLAAELFARRDHRAQIFDVPAGVGIFHHRGDSHLAERCRMRIAVVHVVLDEIEPSANEQLHAGPRSTLTNIWRMYANGSAIVSPFGSPECAISTDQRPGGHRRVSQTGASSQPSRCNSRKTSPVVRCWLVYPAYPPQQ